jgi:glucosyl-3-phosphoglycerate synthase
MPARAFHHSAFSAERIAAERARRGLGVSVCLPARECAATVGEIVGRLSTLREAGAIDAIVVVDAASPDGTALVAERAAGEGGGRVNHLMARPALALLYPELAEIRQPLAGEVAARSELLRRLPFATGYGVETAMLIDAWRELGVEGIAQVDLDEHRNRHQPLSALAPMALTVLATALSRAQQDGRATLQPPADALGHAPLELPPLASLAEASR